MMSYERDRSVDGKVFNKNREIDLAIHGILSRGDKIGYKNVNTVDKSFTKEQFKQRWDQLKEYRSRLRHLKNLPVMEQRSEEWYRVRQSVITASSLFKALAKHPSYIRDKASNHEEYFSSKATAWGNKYEPIANMIYSDMNGGVCINEFGLVKDEELEMFGASPDGISDLGIMLEIKCPYSRDISDLKIKPEYWHQIQGQLAACKLQECDFAQFKIYETSDEAQFIEMVRSGKYEYYGATVCVGDEKYRYEKSVGRNRDIGSVQEFVCNEEDYRWVSYWLLEDYNIQRVYFDQERWLSEYVPEIVSCWEMIEDEKKMFD